MIPAKVLVAGFSWKFAIDLGLCIFCLIVAYRYLHHFKIPVSWYWTGLYSGLVAAFCEMLHITVGSNFHVLLPAFCFGCIARAGHKSAMDEPSPTSQSSVKEERKVKTMTHYVSDIVSFLFMILAGLLLNRDGMD